MDKLEGFTANDFEVYEIKEDWNLLKNLKDDFVHDIWRARFKFEKIQNDEME